MALVLNTHSATLPDTTPNLLPLHIAYSGPAPISTYFLVKKATQAADTTVAGLKRVFTAAFRGRVLHGLDVPLPPGYAGLSVRTDQTESAPVASTSSLKPSALKRRRTRDGSPTKERKRAKDAAPTRLGMRRTRSAAKLADVQEAESMEEPDMYAMMSEVVEEGDEQADQVMVESGAAGDVLATRFMTPVGRFDSILIWNPDMPIDEGRDEYIRAMDEWTRLADVVRLILRAYSYIDRANCSCRYMLYNGR